MSATLHRNFLLDARTGWREAVLDDVEVDPGGALALRPVPGGGRVLARGPADAVAVAPDGGILLLDARAIAVNRVDPCTGELTRLPCLGGEGSARRRLRAPRGIAVSPRGDLYLADTGNRRVQVFDLASLALRAVWEDDWEPWDVAAGARRVYVSDRANGLVHCFECGRRAFASDGADPAGDVLHAPTHLALDREDRVHVAQEGRSDVVVLDADGRFVERLPGTGQPGAMAVDTGGRLLVVDDVTGAVHRYCRGPLGTYAYAGRAARMHEAAALTCDRAGDPLAVAPDGRVVAMRAEAAYAAAGSVVCGPLDSEIPRCAWHRVVLRATVAAGTSVSVETFTSEAERPADHVAALAQERWATGAVHADPAAERWDCLVQSPPGRHLWLRLRLTGSGAETARVHDVEVELPRQTSLRFLPAVYREDPVSADFLERMLAIFDTIRDGVGGRLDDMPRNLDPRGAPAEPIDAGGVDFLSWLASWMGLALERHWTEDRRRRLVEHAHRLYALRGTPAGLALHLRLYTGVEPRIVEHYKLRRWAFLGSARLGAAAELYGQAVTARLQLGEGSRVGTFALVDTGDPQRDPLLQQAHRMTVFVPLARRDVAQVRTIERIVELATPAHVQADVKVIDPGFRVGTHALLGIDTALGRAPDSVRLRSGRLGSDTVLAAGGRRASRRIGFTTVVE